MRFASILLIVSAMMLPRWAAAQSIKINVWGISSGVELTGLSLADALQGVQLDTISEISVVEGSFTAEDWNFLRDNRSVLKFRHFSIYYEVSCADIPDTQEGQPYFANIEHLYVGIHPPIKRVGNYAFAGLDQFDHFQIDRFEEVGEGAYKNCTALRFFNGPYVKSIGAYAFAGCSMLESIVLSWTPPAVGVGAFPATLLNNPQLTLVGNSGHDITGDSLSLAMLLYSADDGYNHTTKTWHGFPINIGSIRGVAVLVDDQPTPYIGTTLESALTPYVMASPDPILAYGEIRKLTVINGSIEENDWISMSPINRFALHIVDAGSATYKDQTNAPYPMPSGMYELVDTNSYDWDMAPEQFAHSNLTRVHLGKVASLKSTFVGSRGLRQAILPEVTRIEGGAFVDCEALTDIQIPKAKQILDRSFAGCTALEHIDLPELTTLNYGVFASCDRLTTLTLPKLQTIVADYITSNFPINISLLRLPATPPVFKDKDGYDFGSYSTAKEYYDRYQYPAKRYIELIDANGNLLTGDALNAAIAGYKADVNWDETTQTWCGWTLVDGSSTLLYQLSAAGQGAQIDLPFTATTAGTKVKVDVYGPMPHYISRPRSLNVYKTGDANVTVPFTESIFTDYVVLSFDMPAHDVTVEVNYTPNVMQLTLNGSIQLSGLSLEQCLQGVAPSSVKSLAINSANVFHQNDWDYLANTLTELEHFSMANNIDDLQEYQGDFTQLTKLKSFDAPVIRLANSALSGLHLLEEVNLPKLTDLNEFVFFNTVLLQTLVLPSVTTLNSYTLTGSMAHTISLPKTTVINDYALYYAVNLMLLQLGATPPTVGTDAFEGCPAVRYLQLVDANGIPLTGDALTTAIANYKNDTGWNDTEQKWHGWSIMQEATVTHESICQGEAYTWTDGNGNTYTQAGAYADPSDIANPKTLILSVLLPSSSNIATQICQGESYTLNGIDYTRSGVYTETLQMTTTGCDSVVTLNLKVNKPVSHELSHIAESSYTWNGETYTTSGEYVQTLSAANGCDSTVTLHLTITQPTKPSGVRGAELESLALSPNPTTGELWVSVPELAESTAAEVLVYNAAGKLLQRVAARAASTGSAASRLSIDLSGLPAGLYIVRSGNAVAKVVKQ